MLPPRVEFWYHRLGILAFVLIPIAGTLFAVGLLWERAVSGRDLALLAGMYFPLSLGITVGFHRYMTHRGFRTSPVFKVILLILGSFALIGAAVPFAATHRKHHALSDQDGDPHSPLGGYLHAHVSWLFIGQKADPMVYARDLLEDRVVMTISRLFPLWAVLSLAIPFAIGGWSGLIWGGLVRVCLMQHMTWSVNSLCHSFGRRPFATRDLSRNYWVVGVLGLGEGWHNNHHAFPRSALHGLRWWQLDLSGMIIRGLERVRLVSNVQRVSKAEMRLRIARASEAGALGT